MGVQKVSKINAALLVNSLKSCITQDDVSRFITHWLWFTCFTAGTHTERKYFNTSCHCSHASLISVDYIYQQKKLVRVVLNGIRCVKYPNILPNSTLAANKILMQRDVCSQLIL